MYAVYWPRFELDTFHVETRSVVVYTNMLVACVNGKHAKRARNFLNSANVTLTYVRISA